MWRQQTPIARGNAKMTGAFSSVRPSQHILIRGPSVRPSVRRTMLRRVSFQHLLICDVAGTPPDATSHHHTSPYVTPHPVKPSHVRSRRRTGRNVMRMYMRIAATCLCMFAHCCKQARPRIDSCIKIHVNHERR